MNCPKCGSPASSRRNRCEACGYDLTIYRKTQQLSNHYYNQGLEKAKVRDLSGAVVILKKSLEMNKTNTNARNLLGLVLYETGETVAAISEWVISKHFQAKENDADVYMDAIQANPEKLDAMNQAIRKYNTALEAAKQGTVDLAIIQLKKVINLHPNYIRAVQLLALLYMKNSEWERARRLLLRISRIDISNTITLRYLAEINHIAASEGPASQLQGDSDDYSLAPSPIVIKENSYIEDKPNIMTYVNLIIGILIGIAVVSILIMPTREKKLAAQYNTAQLDYSEELNNKLATINSLETELTAVETKNEELERAITQTSSQVEYVSVEDPKYAAMYTALFEAIQQYINYTVDKEVKTAAGKNASQELCLAAADALVAVDITVTEDKAVISEYQKLCDEVLPEAASYTYKLGKEYYDNGSNQDAVTYLSASNRYDPTYDRAMYYLAKAYQALSNNDKAIEYYELLLEKCPDSSLAAYATEKLAALKGN